MASMCLQAQTALAAVRQHSCHAWSGELQVDAAAWRADPLGLITRAAGMEGTHTRELRPDRLGAGGQAQVAQRGGLGVQPAACADGWIEQMGRLVGWQPCTPLCG